MYKLVKRILIAGILYSLSISTAAGIDFQDESDLEKADNNIDKLEKNLEMWEEDMEKWGEDLERSIEHGNPIPSIPPIPGYYDSDENSIRLGIYLSDLDFEEAYEMHYDECYGVLVTGVVKGGNSHKAGLTKGDIIMEFDGQKVRYEDHLISLRDTKRIGDTVTITYFRNENVLTTDVTFEKYTEAEEDENESWTGTSSKKNKKMSVGFGGGGPYATFVDYDLKRLNNYIESRGFDPIKDDALVFVGGGGMGNVGNGLFIGGMGAGFKYESNTTTTAGNERKLNIESGFGGVQVVKKVALFSPKVIFDFGTVIGGGRTTIEVGQTDGNYSWDNTSVDNTNNWYEKYEKDYFVLYPSVGVMVRVKSWFGIHASAGYLKTYSPKDAWKSFPFEDDVAGPAPEPINGQTLAIGVWFGH